MPFTGGFSPSPEQTGGGDGGGVTNAPRLQRVFEGLVAARGPAFDGTVNSAVGAENMAYARAITFDLYGANERFANEMNPATATVLGNLPRWEQILAQPPQPGDTEPVRQARCAAALARFGQPNSAQPIADMISAALGPIFVGLTLVTPANALVWWPSYGGNAAYVSSVSGNQVTIAGLTSVPTAAPGLNLVLSNATHATNDGTFQIQSRPSSSSVVVINNYAPVAPDYGIGGSSGSPTIVWSMPNPVTPWLSTVAHIDILVNPAAVAGYTNPDGTNNAKFYATVNLINPLLDWALPADCTWDWYMYSSLGAIGFVLDDPNNLDCEAMDS